MHLDLLFEQQFGDQPGPYERLLADALAGKQPRFAREDSVLETWRIVQPLLDKPCELETYRIGKLGAGGRLQPAARLRRLAQAVAAGEDAGTRRGELSRRSRPDLNSQVGRMCETFTP